jgi:ABC-type uncharacterized transport system fused permease/ATPase subunit
VVARFSQQRLAFARALVQKPEWIFLDEATSAVDELTEAGLYRLLAERFPGTTVFSVGHRETLERGAVEATIGDVQAPRRQDTAPAASTDDVQAPRGN